MCWASIFYCSAVHSNSSSSPSLSRRRGLMPPRWDYRKLQPALLRGCARESCTPLAPPGRRAGRVHRRPIRRSRPLNNNVVGTRIILDRKITPCDLRTKLCVEMYSGCSDENLCPAPFSLRVSMINLTSYVVPSPPRCTSSALATPPLSFWPS